jgi:hypothetical protein
LKNSNSLVVATFIAFGIGVFHTQIATASAANNCSQLFSFGKSTASKASSIELHAAYVLLTTDGNSATVQGADLSMKPHAEGRFHISVQAGKSQSQNSFALDLGSPSNAWPIAEGPMLVENLYNPSEGQNGIAPQNGQRRLIYHGQTLLSQELYWEPLNGADEVSVGNGVFACRNLTIKTLLIIFREGKAVSFQAKVETAYSDEFGHVLGPILKTIQLDAQF